MPKYATINFIQRKEICEKYQDGASAEALAEEYGCHSVSVYRFLREANVPVRHKKGAFDSELADTLRKEYEAGATSSDLAFKYKTTKARVCNYIREAGGTIRPRGPRKGTRYRNESTRTAEIVKTIRFQMQWTQEELGSRIGIGRSQVCNIESGRHDIPAAKLLILLDEAGWQLTPPNG